jgi:ABC-type uncharacterized transport system substrate-binding protein
MPVSPAGYSGWPARCRPGAWPPRGVWPGGVVLLVLAWVVVAMAGDAVAPWTLLVLSGRTSDLDRQIIGALEQELAPECVAGILRCPLHWLALDDLEDDALERALTQRQPTLVVTLGAKAAQAVAASGTRAPVLYGVIYSSLFDWLPACGGATGAVPPNRTALYLEQPPARQLALVRAAMPGARRVGVILGPTSGACATELDRRAPALGLSLEIRQVTAQGQVGPVLRDLWPRVDVLLALADPQVYTAATVANLLLACLRARVPVVAYSAAFVRAGAAAAVLTTPQQVGSEIGARLRPLLSGQAQSLPPPAFPSRFQVSVNPAVTRALGLQLPTAGELERRLQGARHE